MNHIPGLFSNFGPDILAHPENMAGCPHLYKLSVIGLPVKRGVYQHPPLPERFFYIEWDFYIGPSKSGTF